MDRPGRRRRPLLAVPLLAVSVLLAGCSPFERVPLPGLHLASTPKPSPSATTNPALARYYGQTLTWGDCGGGFQCSTLQVPLDYTHPEGTQIGLALIRHPATDRAARIGSLVMNPGGPGGSGVDYARAASEVVSPAVLARYDIVGFDPRGVDRSSPITCVDDQTMDAFVGADPDPQTPAQQDQVVAIAKQFDAGCEARSGSLLPFVGTRDAAHDMDILRQALGEPKLDYLGKSYGTYLGTIYAEEFPTNVGRFVLDGALDPKLSAVQEAHDQAAGFQLALTSFLTSCAALSSCPTGPDPNAGEQRIASLFTALRTRPLPGTDGRQLTEALALTGVIGALYTNDSWPGLRTALRLAFAGDGRGLLALADSYNDRGPDGHYESNETAANLAVNCLDQPDVSTPADVEALLPSYQQASPLFGAALAWSNLSCAYWPVPPNGHPHAVHVPQAPTILVVGTTRDPATPYQWAQGLAAELPGDLLTWQGDGHTAYRRGSGCVDTAVDAYLLNDVLPPAGTVCR